MPPQLAALLIIIFIGYLFWVDIKNTGGGSKALIIPLIWMLLGGSRFASQWLNLSTPQSGYQEGNGLDAAVFVTLILAGVAILVRRGIGWGKLFRQNIWIWLFFAFAAASLFWSEFPFVSLKRLIKALGNVIMTVVILTEERPFDAFGVIVRHFSFLLVPLSVLFIKFYPDLGRAYHMGMPLFSGVATQKNGLGQICLLSAIYFSWGLLFKRQKLTQSGYALHPTHIIILLMVAWLFRMADSATSNACMAISLGLFFVARQPAIARRKSMVLFLTFGSIGVVGLLEVSLNISTNVIIMLGRRPDLTTRVPMWEDLLGMASNPIVGFGYESFWLGARREFMNEHWGITSQAHNGYLEMYLNMGFLGLFFLFCWTLSGLVKIKRYFSLDYPAAVLRLCFVVVVLVYNWTEATFYGVSVLWIIFLLGVMETPFCNMPEKLQAKLQVQGAVQSRYRRGIGSPLTESKISPASGVQFRLPYCRVKKKWMV